MAPASWFYENDDTTVYEEVNNQMGLTVDSIIPMLHLLQVGHATNFVHNHYNSRVCIINLVGLDYLGFTLCNVNAVMSTTASVNNMHFPIYSITMNLIILQGYIAYHVQDSLI